MSFCEDRFSQGFQSILSTIKEIATKKEKIVERLTHMKSNYNEAVKTNTKKLYVFCLDALFYQYKSLSAELEQIESSRKGANNRMYCEYYKLYGMVLAYLDEIGLSYENKKPLLKPYQVYKDLEPFLEYDIGDIENIFSNLMIVTNMLSDLISKNDAKIEEMGTRTDPAGFSMTNYVNAMKNENLVIRGQLDMFVNFLSFFLASQQRQWDRVHRRMTDFAEFCSFLGEDSEPTAPDSIVNISVEIVESMDPVETEGKVDGKVESKVESSVAVVDPPKGVQGPEMSFE